MIEKNAQSHKLWYHVFVVEERIVWYSKNYNNVPIHCIYKVQGKLDYIIMLNLVSYHKQIGPLPFHLLVYIAL